MNKITGTIITLNAEKYILRAINSLKNISDEIIVLDSKSYDINRQIARRCKEKAFSRFVKHVRKMKNENMCLEAKYRLPEFVVEGKIAFFNTNFNMQGSRL